MVLVWLTDREHSFSVIIVWSLSLRGKGSYAQACLQSCVKSITAVLDSDECILLHSENDWVEIKLVNVTAQPYRGIL